MKKKTSTIKISFSDPIFYVDAEKRTVVCVMESRVLPQRALHIPPMAAKGKAKCLEGDVFDLELGKKIAKTRAENKLIRRTKKVVLLHIKGLEGYLKDVKNFGADLQGLDDYGTNHEKELVK